MYSIVLATMLTAGSAAPGHHYRSYGCAGYNYCSGAFSCVSCIAYASHCHGRGYGHGYGGYGYGGCYCSSYCSSYGYGCYCSSYGYGCYCSSYGYGCYGSSYGSSYQPQVVVVQPGQPQASAASSADVQALRQEVERLREIIRKTEKVPPPKPNKEEEVTTTPASARVSVTLPSDARLWIDNVECPLTSSQRLITTPPLDPNQRYSYTLKIEMARDGQTVSQSQRVQLVPGETVQVNFKTPPAIAGR